MYFLYIACGRGAIQIGYGIRRPSKGETERDDLRRDDMVHKKDGHGAATQHVEYKVFFCKAEEKLCMFLIFRDFLYSYC